MSAMLFALPVLGQPVFEEKIETTRVGDINGDGSVDIIDAILTLQVIENIEPSSPVTVEPDVDGDGRIGLGEAIYALQLSAGLLRPSPGVVVPANQFNIGDSIGEGQAADGTIGSINHETVWSTGFAAGDSVNSLNERFENIGPDGYYENNIERDTVFNHAASGAVMADFAAQANRIIAVLSDAETEQQEAGMITILLGSNDVCAPTLADMTDPEVFESQYRAGLDALAASGKTRSAAIHVSGIPAIYWLWNAKRNNLWCRLIAWPFVPCENLLAYAADDCAGTTSRLDPDTIYPGDGANCIRRKEFHQEIRDVYNPILQNVLHEYRDNGKLPHASYIDVFDVQFEDSHVNRGDCFHPSETGHALLAEKEWCRSHWGADDLTCLQ